ncbi:MAG: hypothetical protein KKE57_03650, partial [Proteobacteria bacterium]|nr:hypothetical protein [Pseudomonadota bacterium]
MEGEALIKDGEQKSKEHPSPKPMVRPETELVRELFSISGSEALKRVLDLDDPDRIIQEMNRVDFFWLVKKIGEEDSLPLLNMASPEQWEYLLDMELWQRDRIDLDQATDWLGRMRQADPGRFVGWLLSHGESLAYYYFFKNVHVEVRNKDEAYDLTNKFITLN